MSQISTAVVVKKTLHLLCPHLHASPSLTGRAGSACSRLRCLLHSSHSLQNQHVAPHTITRAGEGRVKTLEQRR